MFYVRLLRGVAWRGVAWRMPFPVGFCLLLKADTYFAIHEQSPLGWSNEIDIRPFQEGWSL